MFMKLHTTSALHRDPLPLSPYDLLPSELQLTASNISTPCPRLAMLRDIPTQQVTTPQAVKRRLSPIRPVSTYRHSLSLDVSSVLKGLIQDESHYDTS